MEVNETIILDAGSNARITRDGYLVATPRVARTGIQLYRGDEVGKPDMEMVRVYRPEGEVFHKDSLASYAKRPMTNNHPPELVTSDNWKKYAVGDIGNEVLRDGEFVRVPIHLMDKQVVEDYKAGKKQLSLGYSMDLKWESGKTEGGEAYDAVQTGIRANHLAVVTAARGGPKLNIGDEREVQQKEVTMKTILIDGLPVQVEDRDTVIVERHVKKLEDAIATVTADAAKVRTDLEGKVAALTTQVTDATTKLAAKDAEIETLKKQVTDAQITPEKLSILVKDRQEMIGKATAVLGDKLVVDGKTDAEIMAQVVTSKMGDAAKGWSADQMTVSFKTLTAGVKVGDTSTGTVTGDPVRDAFMTPVAQDAVEAAYTARDKDLQNAWKNQPATKQ